jgi:O-antigen/teichoic acid export membrane protein
MSTSAPTKKLPPAANVVQPSGSRLTINYLLLIGGESLAKLCTLCTFVYLGRILGPELYGGLEFALATMIFFTLPVDFGIGVYGARELARNRSRATELLRDVAAMRLTLAGVSFAVLLSLVAVMPGSSDVRLLLVLYGLALFVEPVLLDWFFQAHDRMHWVALTTLTRRGTFAVLVLLFVHAGTPLAFIGLCECASAVAMAVVCLTVLRARLGFRMPLPWQRLATLKTHFLQAAPIGLSHLAWALQWYCATVLMGLLAAGEELGWFAASHRVIMALHTFVYLYFFNLLPSLSRGASQPAVEIGELTARSLGLTMWGGIAVALALTVLGGDVLSAAYGSQFLGVHRSLAILSWLIPIALLNGHYRYVLIACNQQRLEFTCSAVSAATALVLAVVLIPYYGSAGAAFALVGAGVVNLGLAFAYVNSRIVRITFLRHVALPLAACAVAFACFTLLEAFGTWLAAACAGTVYLALFLLWAGRQLLVGRLVLVPAGSVICH